MAKLDATGPLYRVDHVAQAEGQLIVNVMHWRRFRIGASPPAANESQLFLTALITRWNAIYALLSDSVQRQAINLYSIRRNPDTPGPPNDYSSVPIDIAVNSDTGQVAGDYLPTYCAASVRFLPGGIGHFFRGAMRLATIPESSAIGNKLDNTVRANLQTACDALVQKVVVIANEIEMESCIWSKLAYITLPADPEPGASTLDHVMITGSLVHSVLGTQNSRKMKRPGGS